MAEKRGVRTVTDGEVIEAIKEISDPCVSATEVAERIDMSRQGANKRLKQLAEEGILESKAIGSGKAWWIARN